MEDEKLFIHNVGNTKLVCNGKYCVVAAYKGATHCYRKEFDRETEYIAKQFEHAQKRLRKGIK